MTIDLNSILINLLTRELTLYPHSNYTPNGYFTNHIQVKITNSIHCLLKLNLMKLFSKTNPKYYSL